MPPGILDYALHRLCFALDRERMRTQVELPAGIYEVKFGPTSWKGIEVRPGETTTIEPGVLKVEVGHPDGVDSDPDARRL